MHRLVRIHEWQYSSHAVAGIHLEFNATKRNNRIRGLVFLGEPDNDGKRKPAGKQSCDSRKNENQRGGSNEWFEYFFHSGSISVLQARENHRFNLLTRMTRFRFLFCDQAGTRYNHDPACTFQSGMRSSPNPILKRLWPASVSGPPPKSTNATPDSSACSMVLK